MGMSTGANEGLFQLAEKAAPKDDRIMPSERRYVKSDKTVSLNDAIALLKQRKSDKNARIPGGLDDDSPYVKTDSKDNHRQVKSQVTTLREPVNEPLVIKDNPVPHKGRVSTADLMTEITKLQHVSHEILREFREHDEASKSSSAAATKGDSENKLETVKSGRHHVTFKVDGMEFTVKCLDMIQDSASHCLVLCFSDDADSFFTPPVQSELFIRYDGSDVSGKLFYFGMNFRMKELGLRFLGFLIDSSSDTPATLES